MRLVISSAIVLMAAPASAMGSYVTFEVVAWNADGSAALVSRHSSSSGTAGVTRAFELITAGDKTPISVSFDDTQDPEQRKQHVDAKQCRAAVTTLEAALAARNFRGVTLRPEACNTEVRDVLAVGADVAREARKSLVANSGASASARADLNADPDADVALTSGKLALVLHGVNGNESGPAHVAAYTAGPRGYAVTIADLRYR